VQVALLPTRSKRLGQRTTTALDAMADVRDAWGWSDGEAIALHNTFHRAADTPNKYVTIGLCQSMPIPMALEWAGDGDVVRDRCSCRSCAILGRRGA
jgi:hypothetical protein